MKKSKYWGIGLLIATLGFILLSGCGTNGSSSSASAPASSAMSENSGRLVIRRTPDLGTAAVLGISIDNKRVATLVDGQTYDAPLSAGPHLVTVSPEPNVTTSVAPQKSLTVQRGQTYAFTAAWKSGALVLE